MKKLTEKLKSILSGNRGESLVEGLISIVIFTILIGAVSLMIMTALRMNANSINDATERQNSINDGIMENYSGEDGTLTLKSDAIDGINSINVEIKIVATSTSYVAFRPKDDPT